METREKIIVAARELFNEFGYEKTSMDLIAKEAGVTKKTIYSYFKDKNALINYFFAEHIKEIKTIMDKIYLENLPLSERINKMLLAIFDYKSNNKALVNLGKAAKLWGGKSNTLLMRLNHEIEHEIYLKLEDASKKGLIKDCNLKLTTFIIFRIYVSVLFEWDEDINKEEATKEIMEFLKSGFLR